MRRAGAPPRPLSDLVEALAEAIGPDGLGSAAAGWSRTGAAFRRSPLRSGVSAGRAAGAVVHGDFHSGNAALVDDRIVIIDWSDAAISSPAIDLVTWIAWSGDRPAEIDAAIDAWVDAWSGVVPRATCGPSSMTSVVWRCLPDRQLRRDPPEPRARDPLHDDRRRRPLPKRSSRGASDRDAAPIRAQRDPASDRAGAGSSRASSARRTARRRASTRRPTSMSKSVADAVVVPFASMRISRPVRAQAVDDLVVHPGVGGVGVASGHLQALAGVEGRPAVRQDRLAELARPDRHRGRDHVLDDLPDRWLATVRRRPRADRAASS